MVDYERGLNSKGRLWHNSKGRWRHNRNRCGKATSTARLRLTLTPLLAVADARDMPKNGT